MTKVVLLHLTDAHYFPGLDSFQLRQVMHRAFYQAHQVLNAPCGMMGSLVPVVVESLVRLTERDSSLIFKTHEYEA